jgi:hypothetical protein
VPEARRTDSDAPKADAAAAVDSPPRVRRNRGPLSDLAELRAAARLKRKDKTPRMSARAKSAEVAGSGTEVGVNVTGCGLFGSESCRDADAE